MKYLGLPLLSSKLLDPSCKPLIDAILARIKGWTCRPLSYVGRLQLINSVIAIIQAYWTSLLVLPKRTTSRVEQIMRFLWKGMDQCRGGAKVAWKDVACPLK